MTERINEQRLMHWAVKSIKSKIPRVENFPVSIHFHFKFVSHPLDSSNCSYMAKLIEDALEREGILPKDNIKYVKGIYLESMKGETLDMVTVKFKEDKK